MEQIYDKFAYASKSVIEFLDKIASEIHKESQNCRKQHTAYNFESIQGFSTKQIYDNIQASTPNNMYGKTSDAWLFATPHRDIDADDDDATGYDGPRYAAFFFISSAGHRIQSGFNGHPTEWTDDNLPKYDDVVNAGDIVILDLHESHALQHHMFLDADMDMESFKEDFELMKNDIATAYIFDYEHFPSREEVIERLEEDLKIVLTNYKQEKKKTKTFDMM